MGGWSDDDDDPDPTADREARNALLQARYLQQLIAQALADPSAFRVTVEMICELNRLAVAGLVGEPGVVRRVDNRILGSLHDPPPWQDVERHLEELCHRLNDATDDAFHLAAFALWRLNWIHPFAEDGNGRTARALAYLTLCIRIGIDLPGEITIVELMAERTAQRRYREGLDEADRACRNGHELLSKLEDLLWELFLRQVGLESSDD